MTAHDEARPDGKIGAGQVTAGEAVPFTVPPPSDIDWPAVTVAETREIVPGSEPVVDVERVRARWRNDRRRYQRRVSLALDEVCVRLYGAQAAAEYGIRDRWSR